MNSATNTRLGRRARARAHRRGGVHRGPLERGVGTTSPPSSARSRDLRVPPDVWFAWMLAAEPAKRALLALRREGHLLRYITGGDPDPSWEYWVDVEEGLREAGGRSVAVSDEPHIPADEGC